MNRSLAIALGAALCAAGCGGAGLGADTRADITARMTSAQQPIAACYHAGLKTNRKLTGTRGGLRQRKVHDIGASHQQ